MERGFDVEGELGGLLLVELDLANDRPLLFCLCFLSFNLYMSAIYSSFLSLTFLQLSLCPFSSRFLPLDSAPAPLQSLSLSPGSIKPKMQQSSPTVRTFTSSTRYMYPIICAFLCSSMYHTCGCNLNKDRYTEEHGRRTSVCLSN